MFKKIVSWLTGTKPNPKYEHPLDAVTTPKLPVVEVETVMTIQPEKKPRAPRKPRDLSANIKSSAIPAWPFPVHRPEEGKPASTVTQAELEALQAAPIKKERKKRTFAPKPKA